MEGSSWVISTKKMSEIMDDYDAGYEKGLLDGYTKSIVLIRHLQRSLFPHTEGFGEVALENERKILEEAMELIAKKIDPNNNE